MEALCSWDEFIKRVRLEHYEEKLRSEMEMDDLPFLNRALATEIGNKVGMKELPMRRFLKWVDEIPTKPKVKSVHTSIKDWLFAAGIADREHNFLMMTDETRDLCELTETDLNTLLHGLKPLRMRRVHAHLVALKEDALPGLQEEMVACDVREASIESYDESRFIEEFRSHETVTIDDDDCTCSTQSSLIIRDRATIVQEAHAHLECLDEVELCSTKENSKARRFHWPFGPEGIERCEWLQTEEPQPITSGRHLSLGRLPANKSTHRWRPMYRGNKENISAIESNDWDRLASSFPWGNNSNISEIEARDILAKLVHLCEIEDDLFFASDHRGRTLLWRAVSKKDALAVDALLKVVLSTHAHINDLIAWLDTRDMKRQLDARGLALKLKQNDLAATIFQARTVILEKGFGGIESRGDIYRDETKYDTGS